MSKDYEDKPHAGATYEDIPLYLDDEAAMRIIESEGPIEALAGGHVDEHVLLKGSRIRSEIRAARIFAVALTDSLRELYTKAEKEGINGRGE